MKPYKIAELAYDPTRDHPWYILRTGAIAEQGGLNLGVESMWFETVIDACEYLAICTERDIEDIKNIIDNKKDSK